MQESERDINQIAEFYFINGHENYLELWVLLSSTNGIFKKLIKHRVNKLSVVVWFWLLFSVFSWLLPCKCI